MKVFGVLTENFNSEDELWKSDDSVFKERAGWRPVYTRLYQEEEKALKYAEKKIKEFFIEWDCEGEYEIKKTDDSYTLVSTEDNVPWMRFRVIRFTI